MEGNETKRNAHLLDITNLKANRTFLADKICPVTTELKINAVLFAFKFFGALMRFLT